MGDHADADAAKASKAKAGASPAAAAAPPAPRVINSVVVHPLVLLSATDHYYRVARDTQDRRVVGLLLGESFKGRVDVTNSFAVPFEEDAKDARVFFLDHDYLEAMLAMFRKIAAKERVVGFYSTGPKIRPCDLALDALVRKYTPDPVFVIIDVRHEVEGLPTTAYLTADAVVDGRESVRTFHHVPCEVGAYEAEEVGVEHMLRDINDPSVSSLGADVRAKLGGLRGLLTRLGELAAYLEQVLLGKLPPNLEILYSVQSILTLLPNLRAEPLRTAFFEVTNDQHLALYAAALVRSVTGLHDLVANKQGLARADSAAEGADGAAKEKGKGKDEGKEAAKEKGKEEKDKAKPV